MPYAVNEGIRIHYEVEGNGPPLVLQHGLYCPLDMWYELNYVTTLRDDYRLILIDQRGHGDSDKPYNPEDYQVELMVSDIVAVLDHLGVAKAHYLGYSAGGLLGFGIAKFTPERFYSLIIGGMHPYDDRAGRLAWRQEQIQALEKQTVQEFVTGMENYMLSLHLPAFSPRMKNRMLTHDLQAISAWLRQFEQPDFEPMLDTITLPCLLYAGEHDIFYAPMQKAAKTIPGATFASIPNAGHFDDGTWVKILAPHIRELIARAAST
ncbi:MAG: alpha/beta fold hydrolase [Anaerolineae bacterium]|nr:alpha/beta fold hydrolase [Anaerolineae bacterium]